jgi:hypothetical protein
VDSHKCSTYLKHRYERMVKVNTVSLHLLPVRWRIQRKGLDILMRIVEANTACLCLLPVMGMLPRMELNNKQRMDQYNMQRLVNQKRTIQQLQ